MCLLCCCIISRYHLACVNLTNAQADGMPTYECPVCCRGGGGGGGGSGSGSSDGALLLDQHASFMRTDEGSGAPHDVKPAVVPAAPLSQDGGAINMQALTYHGCKLAEQMMSPSEYKKCDDGWQSPSTDHKQVCPSCRQQHTGKTKGGRHRGRPFMDTLLDECSTCHSIAASRSYHYREVAHLPHTPQLRNLRELNKFLRRQGCTSADKQPLKGNDLKRLFLHEKFPLLGGLQKQSTRKTKARRLCAIVRHQKLNGRLFKRVMNHKHLSSVVILHHDQAKSQTFVAEGTGKRAIERAGRKPRQLHLKKSCCPFPAECRQAKECEVGPGDVAMTVAQQTPDSELDVMFRRIMQAPTSTCS